MKTISETIKECDNCHKVAPVYIDRDSEMVCKDCIKDYTYGI